MAHLFTLAKGRATVYTSMKREHDVAFETINQILFAKFGVMVGMYNDI